MGPRATARRTRSSPIPSTACWCSRSSRASRTIDHGGHWHLGPIELKQSPFEQAKTSKHYLRAKLVDLPDWPPHVDPLAGPRGGLPRCRPRVAAHGGMSLLGLGADAPTDLVLDAHTLETTDGIQRWLDHVFEFWSGDGSGRVSAARREGRGARR